MPVEHNYHFYITGNYYVFRHCLCNLYIRQTLIYDVTKQICSANIMQQCGLFALNLHHGFFCQKLLPKWPYFLQARALGKCDDFMMYFSVEGT